MNSYIMKKMYKHLAVTIFVDTIIVSFFSSRKSTDVKYDMKLINQSSRDIRTSAATIGFSFAVIAFALVFVVMWNQDIKVIIAAFFISIGMGRQLVATSLDTVTTSMNAFLSYWASILHLIAKDKLTPDWHAIETKLERAYFRKEVNYHLPDKLNGLNKGSPQVYEYLNEHSGELQYQHTVTDDDRSILMFAQYATKYLGNKLTEYDELAEIQQRGGGISPVVLIAIGTLIWLVS